MLDADAAISALISVGAYEGSLRNIVHALKYQGRRSIAVTLAGLMRTAGKDLLSKADYVVPVPLHWRREHARGFNQAREIARHLGLPVADALIRSRATTPQVELSAEERDLLRSDMLRDRLKQADVRFFEDLHDGPYGLTIYIADPEGNTVELKGPPTR